MSRKQKHRLQFWGVVATGVTIVLAAIGLYILQKWENLPFFKECKLKKLYGQQNFKLKSYIQDGINETVKGQLETDL
jgi:hypothetical protein